jgi:hypothetical protein
MKFHVCFTLRLVYFHDISPNSSWNEKRITKNLWGKSKHVYVQFFFSKLLRIMWKNRVEPDRPHYNTRAVQKVSVHVEYLEIRPLGLDVTGQPVRDVTVHP